MGKICDPPPFTGGQCQAISYQVYIRQTTLINNSVYNNVFTLTGSIGAAFDEFDIRLDPQSNQMRGYTRQGFLFDSGQSLFLWREGFGTGQDPVRTRTKPYAFKITAVFRVDRQADNCGDLPSSNCRCSDDSCRVDCAAAPDGFCCVDHSVTNRLLQVLTT